jgi:hypothetical protein
MPFYQTTGVSTFAIRTGQYAIPILQKSLHLNVQKSDLKFFSLAPT